MLNKCLVFFLLLINQIYAQNTDSIHIRKIYDNTLVQGKAYNWLEQLCKDIGHRLSGSENAQKAVLWAEKTLNQEKNYTVWLQEVMVPHWIRGEKEYLTQGKNKYNITALGGSISTGDELFPKAIEAEVIEITSFDSLKNIEDDKIKGKIVFYNVPFDERFINSFEAYGHCVKYRGRGAIEAAKKGAIACIVRSMTSDNDDEPHTGMMNYNENIPKIPAAAIGIKSCNKLSQAIKSNPKLKYKMLLSCKTLPDIKSYNVIAEIKGNLYPNEVIVVGGHLDSWDKGEGAHDDGAGCVQSMQVLQTIADLNYKPKRTIRCVLFMNEENGAKGAKKYAEWTKNNSNERQIMALESDSGGHTPRGFGIEGYEKLQDKMFDYVLQFKYLLEKYYLHTWNKGHSGVDVGFLNEQNTLLMGLSVDSQRYFDYHHSNNDTFDKINKRELHLGAASMAAMVYLIDKYGVELQ